MGGCFFFNNFVFTMILYFFTWVVFGIFCGVGRNFCTSPFPQFDLEKNFENVFRVFSLKNGQKTSKCFLRCAAILLHIISSTLLFFCQKVSRMLKDPKRKTKVEHANFSYFFNQNDFEFFSNFLIRRR